MKWFRPRYEVHQFAAASDRRMYLPEDFAYRRKIDALRAAGRYQAITKYSNFRIFDRRTGGYVA